MSKEEYIKQLKIKGLEKTYETKLEAMKTHELQQIFLEVTLRCNAKCEHCGSSCGEKIQKDEVSAEDLKRMLKDVANHYDARKILLDVTGGEPLMRKDLFDIMEYASDLGFMWGMTTNGILINDHIIDEFNRTKMSTVSISIDGIGKTHDDFRHVPGAYGIIIDNIKKLKKSQEKGILQALMVTTVVNKKNINELEDLYKVMCDLGISLWRVVTVDPIGRAKKNDDILLEPKEFEYVYKFMREKNKIGKLRILTGCPHFMGLTYEKLFRPHYFFCVTGIHIGSVLANGDIYVCPNVPRVPELIQGNIKKDSFVDVWENKYQAFRDVNRSKSKKCEKCKYWKYCLGDSFHTFDYVNKRQNICMAKMFSKKLLDEVQK